MNHSTKSGMSLLVILLIVVGVLLGVTVLVLTANRETHSPRNATKHAVKHAVAQNTQVATQNTDAIEEIPDEAGDREIIQEVSQYTVKPLPCGKDAKTCADYRVNERKFNQKVFVDAYKQYGRHDDRWDSAATAFLGHYVDYSCDVPGCPDDGSLLKEAKALVDAGCNDASVKYVYARLMVRDDKPEESASLLEECFKELSQDKYPCHYLAFRTALRLAELHGQMENERLKKPDFAGQKAQQKAGRNYDQWAGVTLELLQRVVLEGTYLPEDQRLLLQHVLRVYDTLHDRHEQVFAAINKCGKIDPWVMKVLAGERYTAMAWEARGGDWASHVTKAGWKGFGANLRKARASLTEAWHMHPEYPEAAAKMINVAGGSCIAGGEERMWFDRAVAAQFDYMSAYYSYLWFIHPRWNGSHDEMYNFGMECLNTKRFDTDVPIVFIDSLVSISKERGDFPALFQVPQIYRNICNLYDGLVNEPAMTNSLAKHRTFYGIFAWAAGDYPKAKSLFRQVGDHFEEEPFKYLNVDSTNVIGESFFQADFKEDAEKAQELITAGRFAGAVEIYTAVGRKDGVDSSVRAFVMKKAEGLQARVILEGGKWIPFMPPVDFAGWRKACGIWSLDKDGWLRGETVAGGLQLFCLTPVGDNFEIRGELKLCLEGAERGQMGAVLFGYSDNVTETFTSFRVFRFDQQAWLGRGFYHDQKKVTKAQVKEVNKFDIQVWQQRVTVYFNGERIFSNERIPAEWWGGEKGLVGIGEDYQSSGFVIRYRNIELRRLKEEPPAPSSEK